MSRGEPPSAHARMNILRVRPLEGLDEKAYSREERRHVVGPVMPAYDVEPPVQYTPSRVSRSLSRPLRDSAASFGLRRQVFGLGFL